MKFSIDAHIELPKLTGDEVKDAVAIMTRLSGIAGQLSNLACALYRTGQTSLADELSELSLFIGNEATLGWELYSRVNNARYVDAQRATGNMLQACLAGITLSAHDRKKNNEN